MPPEPQPQPNALRQPPAPAAQPPNQAPPPPAPPPPPPPPAPDLGAADPNGPPPEDPDPEDGAPDAPGPDGKTKAELRIQDLIAQRNATREYAEYWREEAMKARGQPGAPASPPPPPEPPKAPAMPKLKDFKGDTAKWSEALEAWQGEMQKFQAAEVDRRVADGVQKRTTEQAEATAQAQRRATWNERCETYAKANPDFYTSIANPKLPFTKTMSHLVEGSELGPQMAHHLSKNPAQATRIARMSPVDQAAAMGRLEAQLTSTAPPPPNPNPKPPAPNQPPPPNPLRGAAPPSINLDTCSIEEYLAHRIPGYKSRR